MVTSSIGDVLLASNSARTTSPTCRLLALVGSTRSSGVPKSTRSSGEAASTNAAITGSAVSTGWRMTRPDSPPQNRDVVRGVRLDRPFTRVPSSVSSAGSTSTPPIAAIAMTPIPA